MIDRMPREDMLGNAMLKSVSIRVHLWLNSILSILGHRWTQIRTDVAPDLSFLYSLLFNQPRLCFFEQEVTKETEVSPYGLVFIRVY